MIVDEVEHTTDSGSSFGNNNIGENVNSGKKIIINQYKYSLGVWKKARRKIKSINFCTIQVASKARGIVNLSINFYSDSFSFIMRRN